MERRTYLKSIAVSTGGVTLAGCNGDSNDEYPPGFTESDVFSKPVIENQLKLMESARIDYDLEMNINDNQQNQERTNLVDKTVPTYYVEIITDKKTTEKYYEDTTQYERKTVTTENGEQEEFTSKEKEFVPREAFNLDTLSGVIGNADWSDVEETFRDGEEVIKYVINSMTELSNGNIFFVDPNGLEESNEMYIETIASKETGQVYEVSAAVDVSLTSGSDVMYDFSQTYSEINSAQPPEPEWYSKQF